MVPLAANTSVNSAPDSPREATLLFSVLNELVVILNDSPNPINCQPLKSVLYTISPRSEGATTERPALCPSDIVITLSIKASHSVAE